MNRKPLDEWIETGSQSEPLTLDMFAADEPDEAPIIDSIETLATYSIWVADAHTYTDVPPWDGEIFHPTWDEIKTMLDHVTIGEIDFQTQAKGAVAWIPARLMGKRRNKDNVVAYTIMVIDVDDVPNGSSSEFHEYLVGQGTTHLIHSTYGHGYAKESHTKLATDDPKFERYRVVLPLSQECPVDEYKATIGAFIASLPEGLQAHDHASKSLSQLFWTPARRHEKCPTIRYKHNGLPLDWTVLKPAQITMASIRPVDQAPPRGGSTDKVFQNATFAGRNTSTHAWGCNAFRDHLAKGKRLTKRALYKIVQAHNLETYKENPMDADEVDKICGSICKEMARVMGEKSGGRRPPSAVSDAVTTPITWMVPGIIFAGELTILQGDSTAGKTIFCHTLAAYLSQQGKRTLYMFVEDSISHTFKPRIQAAGAVEGFVYYLQPDEQLEFGVLPVGVEELRDYVIANDVSMVVIDVLSGWMPSDAKYDDIKLRQALTPLSALAGELNIAIIAIRHLTKDNNNHDQSTRGQGGTAINSVARMVLALGRHSEFPGGVIVSLVKCNLLGQGVFKSRYYNYKTTYIEGAGVDGDGEVVYLDFNSLVDIEANDLLQDKQTRVSAGRVYKTTSCQDFIIKVLEERGGELSGAILKDMALSAGYALATYERAWLEISHGDKARRTTGRKSMAISQGHPSWKWLTNDKDTPSIEF